MGVIGKYQNINVIFKYPLGVSAETRLTFTAGIFYSIPITNVKYPRVTIVGDFAFAFRVDKLITLPFRYHACVMGTLFGWYEYTPIRRDR